MVDTQLVKRGIEDVLVLEAMRKVPRHLFVEEALQDQAYNDHPVPIGDKQTISQPYIVALMTELLQLKGKEKVLEIGTGSGYQAAILAELADRVFSIERYPNLAYVANQALQRLGYKNIIIRVGDGTLGWPEEAPFAESAMALWAGRRKRRSAASWSLRDRPRYPSHWLINWPWAGGWFYRLAIACRRN